MKTLKVIRRLAALVLLAALFLPLSRCSESRGSPGLAGQAPMAEEGQPPAGQEEQPPAPPPGYRYFYAWTDFRADSAGSWLVFLVFLWPLPFLAHEWVRGARPVPLWEHAVQLPLVAGSVALLYYRTFLDELWVGGYLAYAGLGCFAAALLAEVVRGVVSKVKRVQGR